MNSNIKIGSLAKLSPKGEWVEFETETGLKAKALILNDVIQDVKLISRVPKTYYYSALNEAGLTAEGKWPKRG